MYNNITNLKLYSRFVLTNNSTGMNSLHWIHQAFLAGVNNLSIQKR